MHQKNKTKLINQFFNRNWKNREKPDHQKKIKIKAYIQNSNSGTLPSLSQKGQDKGGYENS